MNSLTRLTPVSDLLDWLDPAFAAASPGLIRIEDFVRDGAYVIRADLPGVDPEKDIAIEITGDLLTISGQRREERHDKQNSEVRYGSFSRTVRLPAGCTESDVTARYAAGVLDVSLPMSQPAGAVKVPVQRGEE